MELVLFFSCVFLCCIIILMIFQNYWEKWSGYD
jgi:hypothetical protein